MKHTIVFPHPEAQFEPYPFKVDTEFYVSGLTPSAVEDSRLADTRLTEAFVDIDRIGNDNDRAIAMGNLHSQLATRIIELTPQLQSYIDRASAELTPNELMDVYRVRRPEDIPGVGDNYKERIQFARQLVAQRAVVATFCNARTTFQLNESDTVITPNSRNLAIRLDNFGELSFHENEAIAKYRMLIAIHYANALDLSLLPLWDHASSDVNKVAANLKILKDILRRGSSAVPIATPRAIDSREIGFLLN